MKYCDQCGNDIDEGEGHQIYDMLICYLCYIREFPYGRKRREGKRKWEEEE